MSSLTQRDAFWNKVYDLAKLDRDIVVVSADMGAPSLDKFRTDLPAQFVNVGIAEQNCIVVAAGLAMSGKHPFVYAIAPFITLRCLEQIRVENAIMNIPITIVGVGAGFGYDDSGPTHHLTEDITVMRSMPNIVINSISDNIMAEAVAEMSCSMPNTNYIRLERQLFPRIYEVDADFCSGMAVVRDGDDACVIATGSMVHAALEVAEKLSTEDVSMKVLDVYTLPINESLLLSLIGRAKTVITIEEHFLPGGLGSAVCEVLNDANSSISVKRIGLPIEKGYCYKYGGREEIRKYYGIDQQGLLKQVTEQICHETQLALDEKQHH
ncbi:MAG: 1-deoxy-D-xylulose-5-phosphate synthase [Phycisphaerae bacterium]|nr:1-deoxy-D-xylulose-5-phosphate synthase [Phycisphaerae bacterium]